MTIIPASLLLLDEDDIIDEDDAAKKNIISLIAYNKLNTPFVKAITKE
jgi:hypothetical protein